MLNAALDHVLGGLVPQRIEAPPGPGWLEILTLLPSQSPARFVLARFGRWSTQIGLEPEAVDDEVLLRFERELRERSLTAEPTRLARDVARHWNAAADQHADWPQRRLTAPDRRIRVNPDWESYPTSLRAEVDRWLDWLGRDLFADRDFRPLRPASLTARLKQIQAYLGALVEAGEDPSSMTSLAAVISPAQARRALQVIHRRAGERITAHLGHVAGTVVTLARHWVRLDAQEIDVLRRLARNLRPEVDGLAPRNETRLAQVNDPRRLRAVLALPQRLAKRVQRQGEPTVSLAREMQAAVAIEILTMTGLRIANLASLRIGESLLLRSDGGVDCVFPGIEVKNHAPLTADLPAASARLVRRYIEQYRPLLGDAAGPFLFAGMRPGTHKSKEALREQISGAMRNHAGVAWHPHLFRHFLALLQLENDPGSDALITRALGHKRGDTTRRHYSGLQAKAALRRHDELVLRRRAELAGQSERR